MHETILLVTESESFLTELCMATAGLTMSPSRQAFRLQRNSLSLKFFICEMGGQNPATRNDVFIYLFSHSFTHLFIKLCWVLVAAFGSSIFLEARGIFSSRRNLSWGMESLMRAPFWKQQVLTTWLSGKSHECHFKCLGFLNFLN